ncbi:MAG: bZIP transcription factor [Myxococcota bacterium]
MVKRSGIFRFQLALALLTTAGCSGGYQEKVIGRLLDYSEQTRRDPAVRSQLTALGMSSAESINAVAGARPHSEKDAKAELLRLCQDVDQEAGEVACEPEAAEWIPGLHGMKQELGRSGKVLLQELRISRGGLDIDGVAAVVLDGSGYRRRVVQVFSNGTVSKGLPYGEKSLAEVLPKDPPSTQAAHPQASDIGASGSLVCPFGHASVNSLLFERFDQQVLKPLLREKEYAWLEAKPGRGCVRIDVQTPSDRLKLSQRWRQWSAGQEASSREDYFSTGPSIFATGDTDNSRVYLLSNSTRDGQREKEKIEELEHENQNLTDQNEQLARENRDLVRENGDLNERIINVNTELLDLKSGQQPDNAPDVAVEAEVAADNNDNAPARGRERHQRRASVDDMGRGGGLGISPQELRILQLESQLRELREGNERRLAKAWSGRNRSVELGDWWRQKAVQTKSKLSATVDSLNSANEQIVKYKRDLDEKEKFLKEKEIVKSLYQIAGLIADVKKPGSSKVRKAIMSHADSFPKLDGEDLVRQLLVASKYNFDGMGEKEKAKTEIVKRKIERVLLYMTEREPENFLSSILTIPELDEVSKIFSQGTRDANPWLEGVLEHASDMTLVETPDNGDGDNNDNE